MKHLKTFEGKKHKYKIGDWVFVDIQEHNFYEAGEIIEADYLAGRDEHDNLCYTIDFFIDVPEELDYMIYNTNTRCLVTESEIKRCLNEKEIENAKIKISANKYNL